MPRFELHITGPGSDSAAILPLIVGKPLHIGRAMLPEHGIMDPFPSRRHCQFDFDGTTVTVADTESRSGTLLNSNYIQRRCPVAAGDIVRIGHTDIVLHEVDG